MARSSRKSLTQSPHRQPEPARAGDDSIKETCESIIIALILAFTFRAYVVEAFVIPTGSMAPTLLGQHGRITCQQCGFRFKTDIPKDARKKTVRGQRVVISNSVTAPSVHHRHPLSAPCPICRYANAIPKGTRIGAGDRILVDKYLYSLGGPRRWDVVVFKNPQDPQVNYIKRLIGLPRELIHLLDGNIYVRPTDPGGKPVGPWRIARKTDPATNRRWQRIQRTVWQPIYHSQFIPRDGGRGRIGQRDRPWTPPWVADDPAAWQIEGWRHHRHDSAASGTLRFDFSLGGHGKTESMYPYNLFAMGSGYHEPIEDVRIAATFQPDHAGLKVTLATTARLDDPRQPRPETVAATIDPEGQIVLTATNHDGQKRILATGHGKPLPAGVATKVELWFVDQEAMVWIDGKPVLSWQNPIPFEDLKDGPGPALRPDIRIQVSGSPVTLYRIELDRDLYYSVYSMPPQESARGALIRKPGEPTRGTPVRLGDDEFFCVGDNGPRSDDGRYWQKVDPWIKSRLFDSKSPGGVHPDPVGIVPRQLLTGRAFLVYFPAPYPWGRYSPGIIPNFGDFRFVY